MKQAPVVSHGSLIERILVWGRIRKALRDLQYTSGNPYTAPQD